MVTEYLSEYELFKTYNLLGIEPLLLNTNSIFIDSINSNEIDMFRLIVKLHGTKDFRLGLLIAAIKGCNDILQECHKLARVKFSKYEMDDIMVEALKNAVIGDSIETVSILIKMGVYDIVEACKIAIHRDRCDMLNIMTRMAYRKQCNKLFIITARYGKLEHMKILRKNGGYSIGTALRMAASGGHNHIIRYCYERRHYFNQKDLDESMLLAVNSDHYESAKLCYKIGAKNVEELKRELLNRGAMDKFRFILN